MYTWSDGRKYEGEWLNNNMHGNGKYTWQDGRCFEGSYEADRRQGNGIYTWVIVYLYYLFQYFIIFRFFYYKRLMEGNIVETGITENNMEKAHI